MSFISLCEGHFKSVLKINVLLCFVGFCGKALERIKKKSSKNKNISTKLKDIERNSDTTDKLIISNSVNHCRAEDLLIRMKSASLNVCIMQQHTITP